MKYCYLRRHQISDVTTLCALLDCDLSFLMEVLQETDSAYRVMEIMELEANTMGDLETVEALVMDVIATKMCEDLRRAKGKVITDAMILDCPYRLVITLR